MGAKIEIRTHPASEARAFKQKKWFLGCSDADFEVQMLAATTHAMDVLLVDDDPGDVLMIEEALETIGAPRNVHVANDGEEAVAFLRRTGAHEGAPRPDVILLDLNMPRMDGRQVLAEIKNDPELRSIPIVVLTTSQAPTDIMSSYSLHANAYVTKPMNLDGLTEVVRRIDHFYAKIAALPGRRPGSQDVE